jgi:CHAD domain-containing protein
VTVEGLFCSSAAKIAPEQALLSMQRPQGTIAPMAASATPRPTTKQAPQLRGQMTCAMAFRTAASHYLGVLTAQHQGTSAGEATALHAMRVALTRLRTTIALFLPMVTGSEQLRLASELKWLNAHLGIVRDLDVALERLAKVKMLTNISDRPWRQERAACQLHLTRALRSQRYRRLIRDLAEWIERGDWSRKTARKSVELRAQAADQYCSDQLKQWRKKLLKKSRELEDIGDRKRHRLRLNNKRLAYALEAAETLVPRDRIATMQATLNLLRKTQKSLGQLNDDARYRALAATLGEGEAAANNLLLSPKQRKRLLRKAVDAYDELTRLKPLKLVSA